MVGCKDIVMIMDKIRQMIDLTAVNIGGLACDFLQCLTGVGDILDILSGLVCIRNILCMANDSLIRSRSTHAFLNKIQGIVESFVQYCVMLYSLMKGLKQT